MDFEIVEGSFNNISFKPENKHFSMVHLVNKGGLYIVYVEYLIEFGSFNIIQ
jgi:hypothetical protein